MTISADNNGTTTAALQAVALSDAVTLYRPQPNLIANQDSKDDGPDLIIICTWFRALPKHTAKYLATYHTRYPHAQILMLQSNVGDMMYTPMSIQRKRYKPVVQIIDSMLETIGAGDGAGKPPKVLLHIFSNGGSNSAVQLASTWREQHQGKPLPASAIVFDSAPGSPSFTLAGNAIVSSCPPNSGWWVSILVWCVIIPIYAIPQLLPGGRNLIEFLRSRLNDSRFFPCAAERVYFSSPGDLLVLEEDVVRHCEAAREAGLKAEVVRFERSGHVAHVREDGAKYWGAIEGLLMRVGSA